MASPEFFWMLHYEKIRRCMELRESIQTCTQLIIFICNSISIDKLRLRFCNTKITASAGSAAKTQIYVFPKSSQILKFPSSLWNLIKYCTGICGNENFPSGGSSPDVKIYWCEHYPLLTNFLICIILFHSCWNLPILQK